MLVRKQISKTLIVSPMAENRFTSFCNSKYSKVKPIWLLNQFLVSVLTPTVIDDLAGSSIYVPRLDSAAHSIFWCEVCFWSIFTSVYLEEDQVFEE